MKTLSFYTMKRLQVIIVQTIFYSFIHAYELMLCLHVSRQTGATTTG